MSIALIEKNEVHAGKIGKLLSDEGAETVLPLSVDGLLYGGRSVGDADLVFLILDGQETINAGEWVNQISSRLGEQQRLVLCMPRPINPQLLLEQGADEIISPAGQEDEQIAERILGHLILKKRIEPYQFGSMLGATRKMQKLYQLIKRFAPMDAPALVLGETGTGKELVARALHDESGRTGGFAPINLSESAFDLLADEIFGHTKGAFSGANQNRKGWIAAADNGTVFFDEIGDLEPRAQVKLLRVVEQHKVRPIGSDQLEDVNVRFVFATHRNLEAAIEDNLFRHDLYQRIDMLSLNLPPLRERKADIPLLVEHFIEQVCKERSLKVEPGAYDILFRHEWRGNVRELLRLITKVTALLDDGGLITDSLLQEHIRPPQAQQTKQPKNLIAFNLQSDTWHAVANRAEAIYFKAVVEAANGSIDAAAKFSGLQKSQIYRILKKHGLSLN